MTRIPVRRQLEIRFSTISITLTVALLAGCHTELPVSEDVAPAPFKASQIDLSEKSSDRVLRSDVLRIAEAYATHTWTANPSNIFHGFSRTGVRIDTPDEAWWTNGGWHSDGRVNIGVPYCWGGGSSIKQFDNGLRDGRPAGHVFIEDIRPRASSRPVGIDCSGFISRCWQLKGRRATYDLEEECERLKDFDALRPGDAINKTNDHVVLFKGWLDDKHTRMRVFEAALPKVQETEYATQELVQDGYIPIRYRGIVDK